jgi:putative MATE family efflux protein
MTMKPEHGPAGHAARSLSGPLWKRFLVFLAPMMLANVLQGLSGTINGIFLGQMIGVEAVATVAVLFPVVFFLIAFVIGVGAGSAILIGQAYGAGATDKLKAIAGTSLSVTLIFGVLVALFGGAFTDRLLIALQTPADILPAATAYARVMLLAMPGLFVFLLVTSMMRGVGDSLTPLYTLGLSTAVGFLVTPALIRGWFGLPKLGVVSAACASIVSFVVALAWLAFYLRHKRHPLAPDMALLRHMRIEPQLLKRVLGIGLPTSIQMVAISLAEIVLLGFVNGFGSDATAAYGAVNQVITYVQFPAISISITVSIFGAQAIGSGRIDGLGAIVRTGQMLNLLLTGGLVLIAYLFSRDLIGLFITDAAVVELALRLLHIVLWSMVVFGASGIMASIMRASGTVVLPMALTILAIFAVEVPAAWLLSRAIGVDGIWMAYPIAFTTMLVLQTALYWLYWKRRPIERLV